MVHNEKYKDSFVETCGVYIQSIENALFVSYLAQVLDKPDMAIEKENIKAILLELIQKLGHDTAGHENTINKCTDIFINDMNFATVAW